MRVLFPTANEVPNFNVLFYSTSFLVRPYRPFKIIWNLLKGKQESRAEQGMVNLIRRKLMSSRKQEA